MCCLILLVQKPLTNSLALSRRQRIAQRVHRKRGDPRRKIAVDWPTAIGAYRRLQETNTLEQHGVLSVARRVQADRDKAGQRHCFEKTAVTRLSALKHAKSRLGGNSAQDR